MAEWRKRAALLGLITVIALASGCTAGGSSRVVTRHDDNPGETIVAISRQMLGAPYRYGGESPQGFDCSGLVRYVYRQIGVTVPHSSRQLFRQARKVRTDQLQPGDLLFFSISKAKISHVGIYAARGNFIHAPSSGKQVSIARLDNPYWEARLVGAGRFH